MQSVLPKVFVATIVGLMCLIGCGPQRGTISGQVTLNGQPLEKGIIVFNSLDGQRQTSDSADIVAGRYSLETTAGMKQVQISAPIVTGTRPEFAGPGAPLVEITEELLPAKFHSESELTFEVKPGANSKDWPLEATPLRR